MKTKVRKPRGLWGVFLCDTGFGLRRLQFPHSTSRLTIKDAKRLRAWLDKAIAWMEGGQ